MPSAHAKFILANTDETYLPAAPDINKSFARYELFDYQRKSQVHFLGKGRQEVDSKICQHANALRF